MILKSEATVAASFRVKLSVVIPCFNEERTLGTCIHRGHVCECRRLGSGDYYCR